MIAAIERRSAEGATNIVEVISRRSDATPWQTFEPGRMIWRLAIHDNHFSTPDRDATMPEAITRFVGRGHNS